MLLIANHKPCQADSTAKNTWVTSTIFRLSQLERSQDNIEGELDLQCMCCKLALLLGLPTVNFWSLLSSMYWKQSKTGWWEVLGTTLMQIRSVLTSYSLIWLNSSTNSLRQTVILQLHQHRPPLSVLRTMCEPKQPWSWLQTTSRKWFANRFTSQFTNQFLNWFSTFTPGGF